MTVDRKKIYQGIDVRGGSNDDDGSVVSGRFTVNGIFENDQFFPLNALDTSSPTVETSVTPNAGVTVPASFAGVVATGSITVSGITPGVPTPSPSSSVKIGLTRPDDVLQTINLAIPSRTSNAAFATAVAAALNDTGNPDTALLRGDYLMTASNTMVNFTAIRVGVKNNAVFSTLTADAPQVTVDGGTGLTGGEDRVQTSNSSTVTKYYINKTSETINVLSDEAFPEESWGEWFSGGGGGDECSVEQIATATATFGIQGNTREWDLTNSGFQFRVSAVSGNILALCGYDLITPLPIEPVNLTPILEGDQVVTITYEDGTEFELPVSILPNTGNDLVLENTDTLVNPLIVPDNNSIITISALISFSGETNRLSSNLTYIAPEFYVEALPKVNAESNLLRFDAQYRDIVVTRRVRLNSPSRPTSYQFPSSYGGRTFPPGAADLLTYPVELTGTPFNRLDTGISISETAQYRNPTDITQPLAQDTSTTGIFLEFGWPVVSLSVLPSEIDNVTTALLNQYMFTGIEALYTKSQLLFYNGFPDPNTNPPAKRLLPVTWVDQGTARSTLVIAVPTSFRRSTPNSLQISTFFNQNSPPATTTFKYSVPFGGKTVGTEFLRVDYDVYEVAVGQSGGITLLVEFV